MAQRDSFLAAICAHPADDTPRLVFADWLEEHGEAERAEFIRVQCQLANLLPDLIGRGCVGVDGSQRHNGPCCKAYYVLHRREGELLDQYDPSWWGQEVAVPLGFYHDLDCTDFFHLLKGRTGIHRVYQTLDHRYRRGFVAEITLPCAAWLEHCERLFLATPLEKVTLTHLPWVQNEQSTYIIFRGQRHVVISGDGQQLDISFPPTDGVCVRLEVTADGRTWHPVDTTLFDDRTAPPPLGIINAPRQRHG